jgi:hypothetical protein
VEGCEERELSRSKNLYFKAKAEWEIIYTACMIFRKIVVIQV